MLNGEAAARGPKQAAGGRPSIDLNCDMGEGMATDAAIFPFISSANIACGGHAGDADTMRRTVELALQHGVAIGAHPSYPDRAGFGRVDILGVSLRPEDLTGLLFEQLHRLQSICREFGVRLRHVKPHGALYNRAAVDVAVSSLVVRAIADLDDTLLVYGLSGSVLSSVAETMGVRFVSEVFADRTYRPDGMLTPRSQPHALIADGPLAVAQVLRMVREGVVLAVDTPVPIRAETVCLHGDGAHAVEFAELIHGALTAEGVRIAAPLM
ncbi:MAG TPA: 5-oxoprolinase subunit PxpA [Puia sp.]|nr:5-oxoprolinase subunit PxpA [Puia sp.]